MMANLDSSDAFEAVMLGLGGEIFALEAAIVREILDPDDDRPQRLGKIARQTGQRPPRQRLDIGIRRRLPRHRRAGGNSAG